MVFNKIIVFLWIFPRFLEINTHFYQHLSFNRFTLVSKVISCIKYRDLHIMTLLNIGIIFFFVTISESVPPYVNISTTKRQDATFNFKVFGIYKKENDANLNPLYKLMSNYQSYFFSFPNGTFTISDEKKSLGAVHKKRHSFGKFLNLLWSGWNFQGSKIYMWRGDWEQKKIFFPKKFSVGPPPPRGPHFCKIRAYSRGQHPWAISNLKWKMTRGKELGLWRTLMLGKKLILLI